ncbi:Aminoacyl-tRNA_hydrolase [Hexamita inflata]|uniref:peptidyl-tRNA hydrolase n=1 Tax=Hexamita inflata TaxID=28002 RepID=A0AA86QA95_9EUKA|nr:Aminoacyl-tRNA hydrolase [Hexamita inflata]
MIVQYIVLRKDLKLQKGALCAQAAHAAMAAVFTFKDSSETKQYLQNLNEMHKVVLGTESNEEFQQIILNLKNSNIDYYEWLEQPENLVTAIALRPYTKEDVAKFFKDLKLLK